MLYGRETNRIQHVIQRQKDLCEADTRLRNLERRAQSSGAHEDHLRLAHERLRSGHDPHEVGLALHRTSPDAHAAFAKSLESPHQRVTVAAAPHFHDWDSHDQAYETHDANQPKHGDHAAREEHNRVSGELLQKKWEAWNRLKATAEDHKTDVQHLVRPRPSEPMHAHMRRLMAATVAKEAISRNRGNSWISEPGKHLATYDYEKPARRLATTANHHWGHSHDTKVSNEAGPDRGGYSWEEWRVKTTPKKSAS